MKEKKDEHKEYLEKFLGNDENASSPVVQNSDNNIKKINSSQESTLEYLNVPMEYLPCSNFYKKGTLIKIRSAKVSEVQNYSIVDDTNFLDITEKMNEMLSSCIKFIYPDGTFGSYKDIKDADRIFLIFMIRELTFQKGNSFAKDVQCPNCQNEVNIAFRATPGQNQLKTFVNYEMPKELEKYYDKNERLYKIEINGKEWKLAPPTIGIQEILFGDVKTKVTNERKPNIAFLKIYSHILHDRNFISEEGIKSKEKEFNSWDMETFQQLNEMVNLMKFGIEKIKSTCSECGGEVHSNMTFPKGASSIFVISNISKGIN